MEHNEYIKMDALEKEHWWFKAKRQFLKYFLKKYAATQGKVLDVGCGTGAVMELARDMGYEAVGIDMSQAALDYCRQKGLEVSLGTADKLPFADNTFSAVFALDVLEHLTNPEVALQEIKRVLKPDGRFIAAVPAHQFLFSYHDRALHHVKRYGWKDFKKELETGFKIEYLGWIHMGILLPAIIKRLLGSFITHKGQGESDVRPSSKIVTRILGVWYALEFTMLKIFGKLPWGLSLAAVAKKE